MQRSRKAFLLKSASDKLITETTCYCKVSMSLFLLLSGLAVLSGLLMISLSDGLKDDSVNNQQLTETKNGTFQGLQCGYSSSQQDSISNVPDNILNDLPDINDPAKADKAFETTGLLREIPASLDEFKSKTLSSKPKLGNEHSGSIRHRVEPGGKEYNYASASKGAKMLAFNKESKGADNILIKGKDKYLRNPCSVEDKFVVIELSEETLVDTIMLANFEHYSCTLKEFEVLGSKVYPTETWVELGNFTAPNAKHGHRFTLQEPKWARYLKLKLLSHYGSDFYCTLSVVEVYGDDAMEIMLEDLISNDHSSVGRAESDKFADDLIFKTDILASPMPYSDEDLRVQQNGRMPSDTILKIIMRKVRSFDINLSVLEKYLEELNSRYGNMFKELDKENENKAVLLGKIRSDIDSFQEGKNLMDKELDHLRSWKSHVSFQIDTVIQHNVILRLELEEARKNQTWGETKDLVMFLICILLGSLAVVRLFIDWIAVVYSTLFGGANEETSCGTADEKSWEFCYMSFSWIFLLLNCILVMFVISM